MVWLGGVSCREVHSLRGSGSELEKSAFQDEPACQHLGALGLREPGIVVGRNFGSS